MPALTLEPGQRFDKLVVVEYIGKGFWKLKCDCGNDQKSTAYKLRIGQIKSCGCNYFRKGINHPNSKHLNTKSRAYKSWVHMRARCLSKKCPAYKHYGGRGIKICERWMDFKKFYEDMGDPPEKHSIDRIDNNSNYTPENCRWATQKQQQRNRRNNIRYSGKIIPEISEESGIKQSTLYTRKYRGQKIL